MRCVKQAPHGVVIIGSDDKLIHDAHGQGVTDAINRLYGAQQLEEDSSSKLLRAV